MSATATVYSWKLPWEISPKDKQRFRKILNRVTLACFVLTIIVPFLPLPEKEKPVDQVDEKRLVKILIEKELPPPPPPKVVKKVQQKKVVKPKKKPVKAKKIEPVVKKPVVQKKNTPPPVKQKSAKEVASGSGLLAFKDELADMRENSSAKTLGERALNRSGGSAKQVERSLVTKNIGKGSGGINTAALSRDVSGTGLGGRSASRVTGPAGLGSGSGGSGTGADEGVGRVAQRDLEKIQITFDRNKSAIFSMYNRALRSSPNLQGKVVLNITIAPSGKVTDISIVSSELADTELEQKLIQRVKLINFGAEDVPVFTFNYPIDFYPV